MGLTFYLQLKSLLSPTNSQTIRSPFYAVQLIIRSLFLMGGLYNDGWPALLFRFLVAYLTTAFLLFTLIPAYLLKYHQLLIITECSP